MRCEEEFKLLMDKTKHFKLPSEDEIPSKRQRRVPLQAEDYVGEYYACSSLPDYDETICEKNITSYLTKLCQVWINDLTKVI